MNVMTESKQKELRECVKSLFIFSCHKLHLPNYTTTMISQQVSFTLQYEEQASGWLKHETPIRSHMLFFHTGLGQPRLIQAISVTLGYNTYGTEHASSL